MPNTPQPKRGIATRHTHPQRSLIKRIYVAALLILLPLLVTLFSMLSKKSKERNAVPKKRICAENSNHRLESLENRPMLDTIMEIGQERNTNTHY